MSAREHNKTNRFSSYLHENSIKPTVVQHLKHLTQALYPSTLHKHFIQALYPSILHKHFVQALYTSTLSKHFTQALHPSILSKHLIQALYPSMLSKHFIQSLDQSILSTKRQGTSKIFKKYPEKCPAKVLRMY